MNFFSAIFLLATLSVSKAAVSFSGACPDVHVVSNFNVTAYLGIWYEYARYYTKYEDGSCIFAQYTAADDGSVTVFNSQKYNDTGIVATITGSATLDDPESGLAKLTVTFPMNAGAPYWVLGTDYDSYAIAWTCVNTTIDGDVFSQRSVFILTRERNPSSDVILEATAVLTNNEIDTSILVFSDQTNCRS